VLTVARTTNTTQEPTATDLVSTAQVAGTGSAHSLAPATGRNASPTASARASAASVWKR